MRPPALRRPLPWLAAPLLLHSTLRPRVGPPPFCQAPPPPKPRLMLVEDQDGLRTAVCKYLQQSGYVVDTFSRVDAAFDAITQGLLPDLIVTDVIMPGLDGYQLLKRVRADPRLCGVPRLTRALSNASARPNPSASTGPSPDPEPGPNQVRRAGRAAHRARPLRRPDRRVQRGRLIVPAAWLQPLALPRSPPPSPSPVAPVPALALALAAASASALALTPTPVPTPTRAPALAPALTVAPRPLALGQVRQQAVRARGAAGRGQRAAHQRAPRARRHARRTSCRRLAPG